MPVIQVAALYSMEEYQRIRDESYKWMNVPYWQSYNQIDRAIRSAGGSEARQSTRGSVPDADTAPQPVRLASIRLERQLDAMQCIEAIRLYAVAHEGKLPDSLEAITDAPVPLDPATGKPFLYQVNGDSATLSAPRAARRTAGFRQYAIRYELKLAK